MGGLCTMKDSARGESRVESKVTRFNGERHLSRQNLREVPGRSVVGKQGY